MIDCLNVNSRPRLLRCALFAWFALLLGSGRAGAAPYIELPQSGLRPEHLAVVYLQGDELSERIARYYADRRGIPRRNLAGIKLSGEKTLIDPGEFAVARRALDAQLPGTIQAYALTWAQPYRVGCMGIAAAFSHGYNVQFCASDCSETRTSPYFHSSSVRPWDDFGIRPTMMLAAANFEDAQALIERGMAADGSLPYGKAFLLETSDRARSVRSAVYDEVIRNFSGLLDIEYRRSDAIANEHDILFYFTGSKFVEHLDTLKFLPGALADHLTSAGGRLTNSGQMSAMRWLEAGATASYGAAAEPCNFPQKFPNPLLVIWHYSKGATALEAYARSVSMPGQGNFIGEPLAAPYRAYRLSREHGSLRVHSPVFRQGAYRIFSVNFGVERELDLQILRRNRLYIELEPPFASRYRIERATVN